MKKGFLFYIPKISFLKYHHAEDGVSISKKQATLYGIELNGGKIGASESFFP